MKNTWQLQEAKARLSEVVNAAIQNGPQIITKHGVETALLISVADYKQVNKKPTKLSTFFRKSPICKMDLDLKRTNDFPRDIQL